MTAAGPELFSPVPELQREWCFLGRYVDVCSISLLVSTIPLCLMYEVAHWVLFLLSKKPSSDCVLPLARSTLDVHGKCVMEHSEIVSGEGVAPIDREKDELSPHPKRHDTDRLQRGLMQYI